MSDMADGWVIPKHWTTTTLGKLCDQSQSVIQTGPFGSQLHAHDYQADGVAVINPTHLAENRVNCEQLPHVSREKAATLARHALQAGDILFARRGEIGRLGLIGEREEGSLCGTGCFLVRVRHEEIHNPFLAHFFGARHIVEWLEANAAGAIMPNLNNNVLGKLPVAYPSKDEQRKIVAILDQCWMGVTIERGAQDAASELKRAAMTHLFTHGLRGEAQKETDIGPMPESWEPRTILDLCEIWSGGTPRKSVAEYWNGDIPWVSGKDLKTPALNDTIDHISVAGVEAASRLAPAGAVLLLVRGMGLARDLPVAVINRPMAFNQDVKALVSRGEYPGQFLRSAIYAGKDRLLSQIVPSAHGTMTLSLNDVETFRVACPIDPDEAAEIVALLDAIDRKIALHGQKRAVLEELFQSLLNKLMTGTISVADLDFSALPSASVSAPGAAQ